MAENIEKKGMSERTKKIHRAVVMSTIVFTISLFIMLYIAIGDWSFLTNLVTTNPIYWIMMIFVGAIVYFSYATYMYFRKYL